MAIYNMVAPERFMHRPTHHFSTPILEMGGGRETRIEDTVHHANWKLAPGVLGMHTTLAGVHSS